VVESAEQSGPRASRPHIPGYGIPDGPEGLLPWSWARQRLEQASTYWIATVRPEGRPHVMPSWGAWVGERFYFEGGPQTRRARNIAHNPEVAVHVERDDDAVIVEGRAEPLAAPAELEARIAEGFAKYRESHDYEVDPERWRAGGLWVMRPRVAFGWSVGLYPADATRWHFDDVA
jgi:nitroimidazol reductase NimA-like FMN-containing flavoprotein (pyridoxamine 5'-phosphate oxidase superfamily)